MVPDNLLARRAVLAAVAPLLLTPLSSSAFENRLPLTEAELKYKTPRTPGPKPSDLGMRGKDGFSLKACTDGKPHCFSSSAETFEDGDLYGQSESLAEEWLVEPFKFDKGLAEASADVKAAIAAYPPGQRGIDGGGFKLVTEQVSENSAYYYVQFEAKKKGYIDDMEFALGANGVCNVRTSSRLGYLDLGVNAKRLVWFSDALGKTKGWKTTRLGSKGHDEYFAVNSLSDKALE